jgi:hypothetical protein
VLIISPWDSARGRGCGAVHGIHRFTRCRCLGLRSHSSASVAEITALRFNFNFNFKFNLLGPQNRSERYLHQKIQYIQRLVADGTHPLSVTRYGWITIGSMPDSRFDPGASHSFKAFRRFFSDVYSELQTCLDLAACPSALTPLVQSLI